MNRRGPKRKALAVLLAGVAGVAAVSTLPAGAATSNGPSTTTAPYMLPDAAGVDLQSLLTVSDSGSASNGYEMVGIPDGLGAYRQGNKVRVINNHELNNTAGVIRAHGQKGAFDADYQIDPKTAEVVSGRDLIQKRTRYYDYLTDTFALSPNGPGNNLTTTKAFPAYNAAFGRFCSGTLTAPGQLYNPTTGNGYKTPLYFANEEIGDESRVMAVTMAGQVTQLPRLGLFSWENTVPANNTTDATVVMGDEDGPGDGSQLWVYAGTKLATGSPTQKAGLQNGLDYVVRVGGGAMNDATVRPLASAPGGVAWDLSEVGWQQSGAEQNIEAKAEGLSLNRIEDGMFDPNNKNVYYFVTTAGDPNNGTPGVNNNQGGGLWRLTFNDVENPLAGGHLELLLDGSESINLNMPDNLAVTSDGVVLIQEDPGNNAWVSRIVGYRIADEATASIAKFDPAQFDPTVATPLVTQDEEASGIIDVTDLGWGTHKPGAPNPILEADYSAGGLFLFAAQVHTATGLDNAAAQVERGQMVLMGVSNWDTVFGGPVVVGT